MIDLLAGAVIVSAGLYLIALGISCFVRPSSATKFLLGHSSSGVLHYLELALRMLLGASLIQKAPTLGYPPIFSLFGWVLIVTTTVLFLVPCIATEIKLVARSEHIPEKARSLGICVAQEDGVATAVRLINDRFAA